MTCTTAKSSVDPFTLANFPAAITHSIYSRSSGKYSIGVVWRDTKPSITGLLDSNDYRLSATSLSDTQQSRTQSANACYKLLLLIGIGLSVDEYQTIYYVIVFLRSHLGIHNLSKKDKMIR